MQDVLDMLKKKKKKKIKKQRSFGEREREREREFHRVSKKHREIFSHLRYSPNENIERNTVRV